MKIGILTFHRAHNYGAVLQAFALQQFLKERGHSVEFIDYYIPQLVRIYKWFNPRRLTRKNLISDIKELKLLPYRRDRYCSFNRFITEKLSLSAPNYEMSSYDLVIIGSDQVWNTKLTYGFDRMYWGEFGKTEGRPRIISYAASMEQDVPLDKSLTISKLLDNFDGISVREKQLADRLKNITTNNVAVTIDPTLLIDKSKWESLVTQSIVHERYVLLYQVRNDAKAFNIAKAVSEKLNCKLIFLSARVDLLNSNNVRGCGPEGFVTLFRNASFIVCTSFHGTVFSCIFHIKFCSVILHDGKDDRVINLLSQLGLSSRGLSGYTEDLLDDIDWKKVDERISILREGSIDFLDTYCK